MPKLELEEVGRARTLQCLPVLHLQCGGLTAWLSGSSLQGRAGKSVSSFCKLAGAVLRLQDHQPCCFVAMHAPEFLLAPCGQSACHTCCTHLMSALLLLPYRTVKFVRRTL